MPAWWKGKSKSHSSSSAVSSPGSGSRKKDAAAAVPFIASYGPKPSKKEKAKSFDEAVHGRKCNKPGGDRGGFAFDHDGERPCHPLPPPLASFFPGSSMDQGLGAGSASGAGGLGSASASVSSVGSSGTDEGSDFQRNLDPVNTPRGRNTNALSDYWKQQHVAEERLLHSRSPERPSDIPLSPRREFQLPGPDLFSEGRSPSFVMTPAEASSRARMRSPGPDSRGLYLSTSAMQPRTLVMNAELSSGRQDDVKSPHPLPLPPSSPTSSSPTVHSLQSKWKKGKLLGRGTFGHVFLAFNSESGQMGAIKEVKVISDDSNSRESLKQLSQEISLLSQLSHPNIVQYYGSELVDDTLCVYLEYVSGGSIHKLLQEYGPFGEPVIRSYTVQLLSGLAYLHGRNTVHRDIKGANILVDPNGEVKLADFGMAKHISSQNSIRSFKGSPYWMAPEVIMNTGGYNLSVDIWSLGCTILEMATTKPPWCQYEGVAAIFKIGNSKDIPEIPSYLSNDAKDFLKLCLQRDPSARPTAAQLMEHPFVRDQATAKFSRLNISRDLFPSSLDGTLSPPSEYPHYGGPSHLHDRDYPMRHTIASYPTLRSPSDLANARTNLSLPVSPSSSPLRSFRQSTWSCLPSPPHPAHARGAPNGVQNGFLLNPVGARQTYLDPFLDISQPRPQPLYAPTRT